MSSKKQFSFSVSDGELEFINKLCRDIFKTNRRSYAICTAVKHSRDIFEELTHYDKAKMFGQYVERFSEEKRCNRISCVLPNETYEELSKNFRFASKTSGIVVSCMIAYYLTHDKKNKNANEKLVVKTMKEEVKAMEKEAKKTKKS